MNTSKHKKRPNKRVWLAITISVIGLVIFIISANVFGFWPFNQTPTPANENPQTVQSSNTQSPPQANGDKKVQQNDQPEGSEDTSDISGVINYTAVRDDILQIRLTIDQALLDGECKLTLTHVSTQNKVIKNAAVIANPSSATCEGFDIPVQDLAPGKWSVSVLVTSGGKTGEVKSEVTI